MAENATTRDLEALISGGDNSDLPFSATMICELGITC